MIFFTSDLHLGHVNLACKPEKHSRISKSRNFSSIEEHDNLIIDNINKVVRSSDTLYLLGDFCFGNKHLIKSYRERIKTHRIELILGNHDVAIRRYRYLRELFSSVSELKTITVEGQFIVLCHYSMRVWEKSHYGSWMLCGHSHGSLDLTNAGKTLDVGVDGHNFRPWSFDEIKEYMDKRTFVRVDHHDIKN